MDKSNLKDFFDNAKQVSKPDLERLSVETHDEVFKRTDCLSCGNCCKTAPPIVTPADVKRIARFLGKSPKQIIRNFTIQDFNGEMSFDQVPCRFLRDDNYCSIYEARPEACGDYPHTRSNQFMRRKNLHIKNFEICPAVEEIITIMENKIKEQGLDNV